LKDKTEYLIDSDILIEHLGHNDKNTESILEKAIKKGNCFTTAINASELYLSAENSSVNEVISKLLSSLTGVLGYHPRYSLTVYQLRNNVKDLRDAMFCSVAINNKLPILTYQAERYKAPGITIISPDKL